MNVRVRGSRPWREAPFVVLDFETTGLDVSTDHVLSFGAVPVEQGRVRIQGALYRVVRPPIAVPVACVRVHGIRPADVEAAPPIEDVAAELAAVLSGRVLVAHAARVELGFLERLYRRRARRWRAVVDVLVLARRLAALERRGAAGSPTRLTSLAELYGVPSPRAHHAFCDALTTAQLFLVLAAKLERHGLGTLRDLTARPRAR